MKSITFSVALAIAIGLSSCATGNRSRSLGDPNMDGKTIAQQICSTCHGADGNSISPQYPKLASQQEGYLVQQLKNFESHTRTDRLALEIMAGMSRDISPKQAKEIAQYFASQPLALTYKNVSDIAQGKSLFEHGIPERGVSPCAACHGPEAKGQYDYPRLAGQHKEYLVKQLHVFRDTQGRPNTAMDLVVKSLSEKEIDQLSNYLSTIR